MKDWSSIPNKALVDSVQRKLTENNVEVINVKNREGALQQLKRILPPAAGVMTASSTTLDQIGFTSFLNSDEHSLSLVGRKVWAENDAEKRHDLRRQATVVDYVVGSVNAVTADGKLVAVDATGSRVGSYLFGAKNVVLVVGVNKIVQNLEEAMKRIKEYVFPLENERAQQAYGHPSALSKWIIIEKEAVQGRIKLILVEEELGY